jgi:hypothetical protein
MVAVRNGEGGFVDHAQRTGVSQMDASSVERLVGVLLCYLDTSAICCEGRKAAQSVEIWGRGRLGEHIEASPHEARDHFDRGRRWHGYHDEIGARVAEQIGDRSVDGDPPRFRRSLRPLGRAGDDTTHCKPFGKS